MGTTRILPVEIIESEILTQLPVESLLRFKSVCKSWNSLISGSSFIKSVRNSNHDSLTLIRMHNVGWHCEKFTDIIGCIDGLVCFYNFYQDCDTLVFKIWNPATKQCLEIEPPLKRPDLESYGCYRFGFGFDPVANDYKIMCVKLEEQHEALAGYIYSCNGGCWSKMTPSNFVYNGKLISAPFIYNGSPFWLMISTQYGKERLSVISCDVREEIFRLLPDLGPIEISHDKKYEFVNFKDSLSVMFYDETLFNWKKTIDIYTFDERCENWSKTSIGPFEFSLRKPIDFKQPEFRGCSNSGDILFFCPITNEAYCANLQNHTIKSLENEGDSFQHFRNGLITYSESLVFIDGMKPFSGTEDEFRYCYLREE